MILFASSGCVSSTLIDDADLVEADLESHPMYLISANGMNGMFSCSNSSLTSSNFDMSVDLVSIPCMMMPYVGTRTEAPFPIFPDQSSANCLSASASSVLVVLMLRSPL
jgi:hypothetical protein